MPGLRLLLPFDTFCRDLCFAIERAALCPEG